MLVFSEQDVIKDPPFSKLDLISCRNLLIYMGGDLQKKTHPSLSLRPESRGLSFSGDHRNPLVILTICLKRLTASISFFGARRAFISLNVQSWAGSRPVRR